MTRKYYPTLFDWDDTSGEPGRHFCSLTCRQRYERMIESQGRIVKRGLEVLEEGNAERCAQCKKLLEN